METPCSPPSLALAEAFVDGRLSRRDLIFRLLGAGLSPAAAGAVVAMALRSTPAFARQASVPPDVSGEVRFMIGPWTDQEIAHHEVVAAAFKALYPNVEVTFKLFAWENSGTEIQTSLLSGAHDIYYFGEGSYLQYADRESAVPFEDLTSRINDPSFAAEKAKYLHWDRLAAYGDRLIGLPICWHPESALFINMDMVKQAGFDATFVEDLDTFNACVKAMTKGTETYGLGIAIQQFGEWYQRARAAGGRFLTEDQSSPAINTPEVVEITDAMANYFREGIAPAFNTYDYNTAPDAFIGGKLAIYSADMTIGAVIMGKPNPPAFEWMVTPWPPGQQARTAFNDIGLYGMSPKTKNKDLAWEALTFWTNGLESAYWAGVSGTYPARSDAAENKYDQYAPAPLLTGFPQFEQHSIGPEPFQAWGTIESEANKQVTRLFAGEIGAQEAIDNIETVIEQEALG